MNATHTACMYRYIKKHLFFGFETIALACSVVWIFFSNFILQYFAFWILCHTAFKYKHTHPIQNSDFSIYLMFQVS